MVVETSELIALVFCFVLSGFFSGSEAILMSIGIDRAKQLIEEGGAKGKAMEFMVDKPSELLTTILVGNNIVNILASSLTTVVATRLFKEDAIGIAVGVTTFVILIFGEIIPKTFARTHAERLSFFVIKILQGFYLALYPLIKLLVWFVHQILGENAELSGRMVSKNDIEYMVQKAEQENSMDSKQLDLISSVLEFPTIKVKDIMIPRSKVEFLQAESNFFETIDAVKDSNYSRYPVCEGELDNIKGFLHVKDLAFIRGEQKGAFDMMKMLKAPFFVYEHMKIQAVFDHMNRKKVHLALVKDETGLVVGIITLEDIVEEVLGEIQDEHDVEDEATNKEYAESDLEHGVIVDATISLRDLYSEFDLKIPLNDNYSTLAGFILDMLGNTFPEQGQMIVWEGYSFELMRVDDYQVREIRIKDVDGDKHIFSKKDSSDSKESKDEDKKGKIIRVESRT